MDRIKSTVLFIGIFLGLGFFYVLVPDLHSPAVAESSTALFDHNHQAFTDILHEHVVLDGPVSTVNYPRLKLKVKDLDTYLQGLSGVSEQTFNKWSRQQQMAFLINAYNGFTLKLVVDNYPVKSIKKIGSWLSSPWKKEFFTLLGKIHHLDWIEHEMLRQKFQDPRVHFAVNCASIGCPQLLNEAFVASKLDQQLTQQAKAFFKDKKRNSVDKAKKSLQLSKIFDWFSEDFTKNGQTVASFAAKYLTDNPDEQEEIKTYKIKYLPYDWNLNSL